MFGLLLRGNEYIVYYFSLEAIETLWCFWVLVIESSVWHGGCYYSINLLRCDSGCAQSFTWKLEIRKINHSIKIIVKYIFNQR